MFLKNINISIKKGEHIGFAGLSGSGKTTCSNIISGLLKPSKGSIFLFGKALQNDKYYLKEWHSFITNISQDIYLSDADFCENIALGIPREDIDMDLIIKSAKKACIHEFIIRKNNGYIKLLLEKVESY